MKMIYAGSTDGPRVAPENYLYNCTRNKACEKPFYIPIQSLGDLFIYFDFPFGQPSAFEMTIEACNGNSYPLLFCNYVIAQKPDNTWYGIFAASDSDTNFTGISFYLKAVFIGPGGLSYTYYSNEYKIDACDALMKISSCYNDTQSPFAFDCNGIYYGYHAGTGEALGNDLLRYYHSAFVRMGEVLELSNKLSISLFNSRTAYKNFFTRDYLLQFELVPTFYKNILIGVFNRGNIDIDGAGYTLNESQEIKPANGNAKLWKVDITLTTLCKQFFSCTPTVCIPVSPECTDNFTDADYFEETQTIVLSNGIVLAPDAINWQLLSNDIIIEQGQTSENTIALSADIDQANQCYVFKWQKVCNCGGNTSFNQIEFGNCSAGGACECTPELIDVTFETL